MVDLVTTCLCAQGLSSAKKGEHVVFGSYLIGLNDVDAKIADGFENEDFKWTRNEISGISCNCLVRNFLIRNTNVF